MSAMDCSKSSTTRHFSASAASLGTTMSWGTV